MDFTETTKSYAVLRRYLREPDFEEAAREFAGWLPQMGPQDPAWAELARARVLAPGTTPERLMIDALVALVNRNMVQVLRNLAVTAASVLAGWDLPWEGLRALVLLRLRDPEAALAPLGAETLTWGADRARQAGMMLKARLLAEAAGGPPARRSAEGEAVSAETLLRWIQAVGLAEGLLGPQRAAADLAEFLDLLDGLIASRTVPKAIPEALVQAVASLPADLLLPRLALMQRGRIWTGHRLRILFRAAQIHAAPPETWQRPLLAETEEPILATEGGARAVTALILCCRGKRPGAPFAAFDSHLAARGIRAIYLRDPEAALCVPGPGALEPAQLAPLRALIAQRPKDQLITIGFGLNLLPALALGLALKAKGILSYSGFVLSDSAARRALGDLRAPEFALPTELDLRPWLAKSRSKFQLHMIHAQGAPADRIHAEQVARYKPVTLFETEALVGRGLPAEMMLRGSFGASLDRMLDSL